MVDRQVYFEASGSVLRVTIDNPVTKNGLDYIGLGQLADCYEYAAENDEIRVMVIRGANGYFYTGGRVNAKNPGEKEAYADAIERLTKVQDANTVPVICAVNGHCMKAGMGLLSESDIAVALKGVRFCFPETRMGGAPMMVMAETITALPRKKALEAYYTSWEYDAEEMLRLGLLNAVTTQEDFEATVDKYVRVFLETPADIIRMTRKGYQAMSQAAGLSSRREIALRMLREEVLTSMVTAKTSYNV